MRFATVPILLALTIFSPGCSGPALPAAGAVLPPWPSMPASAKAYLGACCTATDGEGVRRPAPGSESLWGWLADLDVLRRQLEAGRRGAK